MSRFANNLQGTDTGVFYYAGHGAQVNGDNFLVPIGCEPSNSLDLETGAVKLQTLLDTLGNASVTSVFFLDCCRNNPLPRWAAKGVAGRALTLSRGPAPTLAEIADSVSTHREAVSRELSRLGSLGLIVREGGALRINDVARLADLVREARGD